MIPLFNIRRASVTRYTVAFERQFHSRKRKVQGPDPISSAISIYSLPLSPEFPAFTYMTNGQSENRHPNLIRNEKRAVREVPLPLHSMIFFKFYVTRCLTVITHPHARRRLGSAASRGGQAANRRVSRPSAAPSEQSQKLQDRKVSRRTAGSEESARQSYPQRGQ